MSLLTVSTFGWYDDAGSDLTDVATFGWYSGDGYVPPVVIEAEYGTGSRIGNDGEELLARRRALTKRLDEQREEEELILILSLMADDE